jgi:glycosyltransferase involved in cell wall biosynthesis
MATKSNQSSSVNDQNGQSVSVVIPAYNEAGHIGALVSQVIQTMDQLGGAYQVLVVDDGSSDGTGSEAEAAGACVLRHAYNVGNGAAIKRGVRHATGDIILIMDADGQHSPLDIPRLLMHIPEYDLVIGARTIGMGSNWYRNLANRLFNQAGRKIAGFSGGYHLRDISGIRASIESEGFIQESKQTLPFHWPLSAFIICCYRQMGV